MAAGCITINDHSIIGELMDNNLILSLVAAVISILIAAFTEGIAAKFFRRVMGKEPPEETYSQKLTRLTQNLTRSSREVDGLLSELSNTAIEREKSVARLEKELEILESKEKQVQERIHALENVPIPVAEHFANLTALGEKRSAKRDYLLFGAGVIVTTIISIGLSLIGLV
jgi:hypothetical protein